MSMDNRDGWIWLDGHWRPWREAQVHVLTHTLHYGYGCFEGLRAYPTAEGGAIFRLDEHLRRLEDSCRILDIALPWSREELAQACREVFRRNGLVEGYVRPLVFLGAEKMGVDPLGTETHVAIAAWPWGRYLGEQSASEGIRVRVSSFARHHVNVQMCRAKAISAYANAILAVREARRDHYDEALLLDTQGFIAEGSSENIFLVRDGQLYEPQTTSALDGITRRTVHTLARERGLEVIAKPLTRDELYCADEVFLTGTAAEITPVVEVDRRRVGSGLPGPLTRQLQQAYADCVRGQLAQHQGWLTPL